MKRGRIGAALAAALLVSGAAATPVAAAPESDATSCAGVWVVVEGDRAGCAAAFSSGQEALASAGFTTQDSSPGLLCRIDEVPAVCTVKPSAYWSYWQATRDAAGGFGPWTYSSLGYANSRPQAGNAEGWVFGDGSQPPAPLTPAAAAQPSASSTPLSPVVPSTPSTPASAAPAGSSDGTGAAITGGIVLVAVVITVVVLVRRRRA